MECNLEDTELSTNSSQCICVDKNSAGHSLLFYYINCIHNSSNVEAML